eukprot:CAMPEP_0116011858 /NCGR_PEP_ID=MMETSP0321-20121206/4802_1 /TAXON_ID=163516 /ORGANISM="Leptocylindrus danicus var. danicus, Strain B650" /LENGTH=136 /DNA_ID=CAMNT_0003481139 /DNA_START=64 /DNA_END=474 /DNA_ORIENTATION=+
MTEKCKTQSARRTEGRTKATRRERTDSWENIQGDDESSADNKSNIFAQLYLPAYACASIIGTFDTIITNVIDDGSCCCCCCFQGFENNLPDASFEGEEEQHMIREALPYADEQVDLSRYDGQFLYHDLSLEEEYEI